LKISYRKQLAFRTGNDEQMRVQFRCGDHGVPEGLAFGGTVVRSMPFR
jgi:hypothetical protein